MAPHLQSKREDAFNHDSQTKQAKDGDEKVATLSPWVIVAIIIGVLLVVTIAVFVVLYFLRRRRVARETQQLPVISNVDAVVHRRRKMSVAERREAEDLERSIMIRKSLASRTTLSSIGSRDSRLFESARSSRVPEYELPIQSTQQRGENEWKEWEAGVSSDRRAGGPADTKAGESTIAISRHEGTKADAAIAASTITTATTLQAANECALSETDSRDSKELPFRMWFHSNKEFGYFWF
ncbi:hypothetical protein AB5N19_07006 [Seiridium cardinale]